MRNILVTVDTVLTLKRSPTLIFTYPSPVASASPILSHPIVLFDGLCNLCDASVRFIIDRDPNSIFQYAPLQSAIANELLKGCPEAQGTDSVVLVENGQCYTHSTAALRIVGRLEGAWTLLRFLWVVPRPLRDAVYDLIARNRHRWFGRREHCRTPTPEERKRFLAQEL